MSTFAFGASKAEDLIHYTQEDCDLIKPQVMRLQPEFIVCGNTWSFVEELWTRSEHISPRAHMLGNTLALDYWHPASRYPNVMYYYKAMLLIQKAMRQCADQ